MSNNQQANLLNADVGAALRALSVPMALGIVFILAVDVIDTYYVGQLGTAELAAMSFAFPIVGLVVNVAMGFSVGATSAVSRALGAGDERAARRMTTHALLLAVLVVAVVSGLGLATQTQVFTLLGAGPELIPLLEQYMTIWYAGAVFLVVPMVGNGVQRAGGDARTPMFIMMMAALANAVLDPIFIFGFGPVPAMGLTGAAIATVIARSFTLVLTLYILIRRLNLLDLHWPSWSELWDSWRKILAVAVPAAITNMLVPIAAAVMTALMARQGSAAVAGFGVGTRLEGLLLLAPLAVSASLTPFVGQNWGAHRVDRVAEALRLSVRFALLWGAGVWLALAALGAYVVDVFTDDATVSEAARTYLWIVPLTYGAHGLVSMAGATFNAVDQALRSTLLSALRSLVLAIPLAYVGGELAGLRGLFVGIAVATGLSGLIALWWMRSITRAPAQPDNQVRGASLSRVPAPVEGAIDALLDKVIDIDDITVRARPINTLGFYIGGHELGHVHRSGMMDLHVPPPIHDQLIAEGLAVHHRHIHDASWVTFQVHSVADTDRAAWLLRLGQSLCRLRRQDSAAESQLDALMPSAELRRRVLEAADHARTRPVVVAPAPAGPMGGPGFGDSELA